MVLRRILDICDRGTGYEGRGGRHDPWWQKMEARKQVSEILEEIFAAVRERSWESGRRGEGGGGREVAESGTGRYGPRNAGIDTGDARAGK